MSGTHSMPRRFVRVAYKEFSELIRGNWSYTVLLRCVKGGSLHKGLRCRSLHILLNKYNFHLIFMSPHSVSKGFSQTSLQLLQPKSRKDRTLHFSLEIIQEFGDFGIFRFWDLKDLKEYWLWRLWLQFVRLKGRKVTDVSSSKGTRRTLWNQDPPLWFPPPQRELRSRNWQLWWLCPSVPNF